MNLYEIERYSASHPDWEGSFSERLYEYCEWDAGEFWKLHKTLIDLAYYLRDQDLVDKELMGSILGIQRSVGTMISAHFNRNDAAIINNITEEKLHQYIERFDTAILGLATGKVPSEESFELTNPLLRNNEQGIITDQGEVCSAHMRERKPKN